MNNKIRIIAISCLTFGILSTIAFSRNKNPIEAEAATVDDYYSGITATSGNALLGQVRDLIVTTHKTYTSYGQCRGGTDGDAGISDADPNKEGNIIMLYTHASIKDMWDDGDTWNREHVWPQSLSNELWGESYGGADMHHIRPVFASINTSRKNKKFGVATGSVTEKTHTYNGVTYIAGYFDTVYWEPKDEVKGDVARILLYMFTHYNAPEYLAENTNKTDTLTSTAKSEGQGNLPITNVVKGTKAEAFQLLIDWHELDPVDDIETTRNDGVYSIQGNRNPFIDKPDYVNAIWGDGEISNEGGGSSGSESESDINSESGSSGESTPAEGESVTVTTNIADYAATNNWTNSTKYTEIKLDSNITATVTGGGNTGKYYTNGENWRIYQNESPTLKISAADGCDISSVKITYTIDNSGVLTLNGTNISSGDTVNVNSNSVTFSVGNTGSATNGQVRVTSIEVVYTATISDEGGNESETPVEPTLSSISVSGQTTEFTVGDEFVFGGTVTATYSDGSTADVTKSATFSGYNMSTADEQTVTVTYEGKTTTYQITVVDDGEYTHIDGVVATFEFGDNGEAKHSDGSELNIGETPYSDGEYTLNLTSISKIYKNARDALGNSCLKFGTSSVVGSMTFTVPNTVTQVMFYISGYKDATVQLNINETEYSISKTSNVGEYEILSVDTTTNKSITITTSTNKRAMLDKIQFVANSGPKLYVDNEFSGAYNPGISNLNGKYILGAYKTNGTDFVLIDPSRINTNSTPTTIYNFDTNKDNFTGYYFNLSFTSGGTGTIKAGGDSYKYNYYMIPGVEGDITFSESSGNNWSVREGMHYGSNGKNVYSEFHSGGNSIAYNSSNNTFQNVQYLTSWGEGYSHLSLLRVDTAFNLLKYKLTFMNCETMLTDKLIEKIQFLYSELTEEEIGLMETTTYTTSKGTFTMAYGYQYALDRYNGGVSSDSGRLLRMINSNSYYVVMIISMIGVGALLGTIIIKKRKSR